MDLVVLERLLRLLSLKLVFVRSAFECVFPFEQVMSRSIVSNLQLETEMAFHKELHEGLP